MPSTELFLAFLATTVVFACIPGPAMLYAAARTMAGGRRSGLMAALGIHVGGYGHVIAAAAGLSIIFHAVPPLFLAVKLGGAAYLIWLGIGLFRSTDVSDEALPSVGIPRSGRRAFFESVAVEILNPKTAIFFLAFLPQFVAPEAGPLWLQFLVLGTIVNITFSAVDIVCVLLASAVVRRLQRSSRAQRMMRRAGGSLLVGLGTHLVLQSN